MAKSEIIKQLARGIVDTEVALKQLKLLLAEFPDQSLMSWVDKELSGYDINDVLPSYRKTAGTLKGTVLSYNTTASNIGIPLSKNAPKELYNFCNGAEFRESIGELKSLMDHDNGNLRVPFPPDYYPCLVKYSSVSITAVLDARVEFSATAIFHIFAEVNNKIMNVFMLLEKEFGNLDDLDISFDGKTDETITKIEKQINVYIYNDNSMSIGNENKIRDSVLSSASDINEK